MLVKMVLNRYSKFKSFAYKGISINESEEIEVQIEARKNSTPICSQCGVGGSGYNPKNGSCVYQERPIS